MGELIKLVSEKVPGIPSNQGDPVTIVGKPLKLLSIAIDPFKVSGITDSAVLKSKPESRK